MKKVLFGILLLVSAMVVSVPVMAGVEISVGISLPPPIVFGVPPAVVVLPDTNGVYVVPNVGADLFFWNGWWWRPWQGGWYRSRYYNRGWYYYNRVPQFYYDVDPRWREYYRDRDWRGHPWVYQNIPDRELQRNWRGWQRNRYWERQRTWGVRDYHPIPARQRQEFRYQRQQQYERRPEVVQHRQWIREHPGQPQGGRYQRPAQGQNRGQRYERPAQGENRGQRYERPQQGQGRGRGRQEREGRQGDR